MCLQYLLISKATAAPSRLHFSAQGSIAGVGSGSHRVHEARSCWTRASTSVTAISQAGGAGALLSGSPPRRPAAPELLHSPLWLTLASLTPSPTLEEAQFGSSHHVSPKLLRWIQIG